ncbi:hypothetical protein ZHAS_00008440 [Anopheles sinensis]|uniref:Uncharacterized protein n=1 Tax=Anopheles sinensis TaxID=74873 RepID=A0A084VSG5_ANOSI|nr:hypothetical protein ZHAS_00008440 [Anopheles sinensis]
MACQGYRETERTREGRVAHLLDWHKNKRNPAGLSHRKHPRVRVVRREEEIYITKYRPVIPAGHRTTNGGAKALNIAWRDEMTTIGEKYGEPNHDKDQPN